MKQLNQWNRVVGFCIMSLAVAITPATGRAGSYYVTVTGAGSKDGSSWASAYAGIQPALNAIYSNADANATVYVAKNTPDSPYGIAAKTFTNSVTLNLLGGCNTGTSLPDGMSEIAGTGVGLFLRLDATTPPSPAVTTGSFSVVNFTITNTTAQAVYTVTAIRRPTTTILSNCLLSTTSVTTPAVDFDQDQSYGCSTQTLALVNCRVYTPASSPYAAVAAYYPNVEYNWPQIGTFLVSNSVLTASADGSSTNNHIAALYAGHNSLTIVNSAVTNLGAGYAVKGGYVYSPAYQYRNIVNNCAFDGCGSAVLFMGNGFTNLTGCSIVMNSTFTARGSGGVGLYVSGWSGQPNDGGTVDLLISNAMITATNNGGVGLQFYQDNGGYMDVLFQDSSINGMASAVRMPKGYNGTYDTLYGLRDTLTAGSPDGSVASTNPVVDLVTCGASFCTLERTLIRNGAGGIAWNTGNWADLHLRLLNSVITKQTGYGVHFGGFNQTQVEDLTATNTTFSNLGGPAVWWDTNSGSACNGNFRYCAFAPGANGGNASATNFVNTSGTPTVSLAGYTNAFYAYGSYSNGKFSASAFTNNTLSPASDAGLGTDGYNLQAGSPLIDRYTLKTGDPTIDLYGTARPQGAKADIGAVEYIFPGTPKIVTLWATNIDTTSAGLVGNLTTGAAPVDVVCYWGTNDGGNVAANWQTNTDLGPQPVGILTTSIGGLAPQTTYYFRYYATNAVATNWASATLSFATLALPGAPQIATLWATNVTTTTAGLVGNLTTGSAPVDVICYWGTTDGMAVAANWATNNDLGPEPVGVLTNNLAGLSSNTTYYFRYYATNSSPTPFWGTTTMQFTTLGAPLVDNSIGATNISAAGASLQGQLLAGLPAPNVWICWGTNDGGAVATGWNQSTNLGALGTGSFSAAITNLTANLSYWYRCYASNSYGTVWTPASTSFTTAVPALQVTPINAAVVNGALGTTGAVIYTVTLSAASAVDVSVNYATANGTATASNDYVPTAGLLTIPAGTFTNTVSVPIIGISIYKPAITFTVNFTNAVNATNLTPQVSCTINNTNTIVYVRGDGLGSDTNSGSGWSDAFASLQKALSLVPYQSSQRPSGSTGPMIINVQGSTGTQAYVVCGINVPYSGNPGYGLDMVFQGGWMNVGTSPAQTGTSLIMDATTNHPGIKIATSGHYQWRRLVVNRFAFTNVTRAIEITSTDNGIDENDTLLTISNCTVRAQNDGIYLHYLKGYPTSTFGGPVQITAGNVDILAGLGGPGDGLHIDGSWMGSSVTAGGINPATAAPWVSSICSLTGNGVCFSSMNNNELCNATFSNTVIYGCASNGLHLDVAATGGHNGNTPYLVQATLQNCTIANNGLNGLDMLSQTNGSWATITNCIFAGNSGQAVVLSSTNNAFVCQESYNVFFGNSLSVNGAGQSIATNSSAADPQFYAQKARPSPWYTLQSRASPAYHSGSDGRNRGAYQTETIGAGFLLLVR